MQLPASVITYNLAKFLDFRDVISLASTNKELNSLPLHQAVTKALVKSSQLDKFVDKFQKITELTINPGSPLTQRHCDLLTELPIEKFTYLGTRKLNEECPTLKLKHAKFAYLRSRNEAALHISMIKCEMKYDSANGIFILVLNDGKSDKMLGLTEEMQRKLSKNN